MVSFCNFLKGAFYQFPGINCRLGTLLCKLPDLVCHNCKAAPRFSRPCRFNGRIQRKQVGLGCNRLNFRNNIPNFCGGLANPLHSSNHPVHAIPAVIRLICIFLCLFVGILCTLGASLHGFCNIGNGCLQLFHCPCLVSSALCQGLGRFRQVGGTCRYLAGSLANGAQCPCHLPFQLPHCLNQFTEITGVLVCNLGFCRIVPIRHLAKYQPNIINNPI